MMDSAENTSIITEISIELRCSREKGKWGAEEEGGHFGELLDQPYRGEREHSSRKLP